MTSGIDPFGTGFGDAGLQASVTPQGSLRVDNTSCIGRRPLLGSSLAPAIRGTVLARNRPAAATTTKSVSLGVSWGAGPFYGVVTYDVIEPRATAGAAATAAAFSGVPRVPAGAADQKMLLVGATFDLKFMKIHGAYAKEDNVWFAADLGTGTGVNLDAGADADAWMAGLTFRLFGGELFGSYQTRDGDAVSVCLSPILSVACPVPEVSRERDIDTWAVGFTYALSRRTNTYIVYSDKDGEKTVQNDPAIDRKMLQVGIRHLF